MHKARELIIIARFQRKPIKHFGNPFPESRISGPVSNLWDCSRVLDLESLQQSRVLGHTFGIWQL